jgi:hypothetical protein
MIVLAASVIATPALAAMSVADPACSQPLPPGAERRAATTGACIRTLGQRRAPALADRKASGRSKLNTATSQPARASGKFIPASRPQLASVDSDQLHQAHIGLHKRRPPRTKRVTDADCCHTKSPNRPLLQQKKQRSQRRHNAPLRLDGKPAMGAPSPQQRPRFAYRADHRWPGE